MRVLKQYPHISFLIIFSLGVFFTGVCLAVFDSLPFKMYQHNRQSMIVPYPLSYNESVIPRPADEATFDSSKPAVTALKEVGKAKVTYYSHTNNTISQTTYLPVHTDTSTRITLMQAYFETEGKRVYAPENIYLRFVPMANDDRHVSDKTFKIFMDGHLLFSKENSLEASGEDDKGAVATNLTQEVSYILFVTMSRAKKVQMQVGPTIFELKESDVEAFRDLLKTIEK